MMKGYLLIAFISLAAWQANAQSVKLFAENKTGAITLYAANTEYCPMSVSLELSLRNMVFSEGEKRLFVIPAQTDKYKIGELTDDHSGNGYKYSYKYNWTLGDVTVIRYDDGFAYELPFLKGKSFKVFQGYNGKFSHQNENALDFTMPEGTEIVAAREGKVVKVVQNNTQSCATEDCKQYTNSVTILHPDGTFANYAHVRYNGATVKPGDMVKKGDVIAYSGNTGWSTGPHLHFVCYLAAFGKVKSIETSFRTDNGGQAVLLKEGTVYTKNY
jgi:hypothetical protein